MSTSHGSTDHERFNEDVPSYLLAALPAEETAAFEAHLSGCALCRADVERLQVAADALPASVTPVAAPPALKGRIMAAVEAEAQLLAAAGERADRPEAPASARPTGEPRRRRWAERLAGGLRPAFALPAALLLLALGGVLGVVLDRPDPERVEVARRVPVPSLAPVRTVRATVDRAELPNGRVELELSGTQGRLVGRGMPPAPRGRIYQVWLVRRGSQTPVPTSALFGARRNGRATAAIPGSLEDVEQVLVNHEPLGGSSTPTKTPFISVEL